MYALGTPAHLTASFTDSAGTLVDPTTVTVAITLPDGTTPVGSPFAATRDSTGEYHYDYTTTAAGIYQYYFAGSGTVTVVQVSDVFTVAPQSTSAIISLGDAKEALNKTGSTLPDDAEILLMVRAATEVINELCDYTAATSVTEILEPSVDRYARSVLMLSHVPVMTVQTITGTLPNAAIITVDQDDLDPQTGEYILGTGNCYGPQKVTYTAGRTVVPASIQEACRMEVQYLWQTQQGGAPSGGPFGPQETDQTTYGFPYEVRQLVERAGYKRPAGIA